MIDAAAEAGRPISICGDMARDPSATWLLLGLGLRDLSMDPRSIPMVKSIIRRSSMADAVAFTAEAMTLSSEGDIARLVRRAMGPAFEGDLESFLPAPEA